VRLPSFSHLSSDGSRKKGAQSETIKGGTQKETRKKYLKKKCFNFFHTVHKASLSLDWVWGRVPERFRLNGKFHFAAKIKYAKYSAFIK